MYSMWIDTANEEHKLGLVSGPYDIPAVNSSLKDKPAHIQKVLITK
jgi:hypothetical protein